MAKLAQQNFARKSLRLVDLTAISGHNLKNFAENIVSIKIKPLFILNRRSKFRREENFVRLQDHIFWFRRFQMYFVGKRQM